MRVGVKDFIRKHHIYIQGGILFFLIMLLMMGYVDNAKFITDEEEIFLKGAAIANGKYLYKDIASQHMPLMYYISALFSFFGVQGITAHRIAFYCLMALSWVIVYFRYGRLFNYSAVGIYILGYVSVIAYIEWGTTILSEQIQQFGIVILFLEFLIFTEKGRIKWLNSIWISISIICSFGAAFVSVFPISIIFFAVIIQSVFFIKQRGKEYTVILLKDFVMLMVFILLPWLMYLIYLTVTGTLEGTLYCNYTFNREIYSKYLEKIGQPYGISVIGTYFLGIKNWFAMWKITDSFMNILRVSTLLGAAAALFVIKSIGDKKYLVTITALFYLFCCTTRGTFTFHELPSVAVECLFFGLYVTDKTEGTLFLFWKSLRDWCKLVIFVIICIVASNSVSQIADIWNTKRIDDLANENSCAYYVNKLTDEKEEVGFAATDASILVEAGRTALNINPVSPWFWEGFSEEIMYALTSVQPRVIVYTPTVNIWNLGMLKDYAKDLDAFILENYCNLAIVGQDALFVRKDYYEDALIKLNVSRELSEKQSITTVTKLLTNDDNLTIELREFDAELTGFSIMFGTYVKDKVSDFCYELYCEDTDAIIINGRIDGETIEDNKYRFVDFGNSVDLNSSCVYKLKLTPECETGEEIAVYMTEENSDFISYLNGEIIDGDFNIILYGR